eukprot:m.91052 g.91052  ORF g.91052 m.91052 type:complete len:505 (+) comp36674_c0_seq6:3118-4632(+)
MGKKSRRPRQKIAKPSSYRPDSEVLKLIDQILKVCLEASKLESKTPKEQWNDFVKIRGLLDELEAKQTEVREGFEERPPRPRSECVQAFHDWLVENGAQVQGVTFDEFPGRGFGVKALRDIEEHELFLSIPYKLMMTTLTAKESTLGPLAKSDRLLQSVPNVSLSLFLLCEHFNPDSFWGPYIDMLPEAYSVPLYFSIEEVQLLEGSPAYLEALNQNRSIARQYAYLHQMIYSHPEAKRVVLSQRPFTYADYRWAVSSVMTRQNRIPVSDGEGYAIALISGWDMCNHSNGVITTDYSHDEEACKCYAMDSFKADSEVTMFYGARTDSEFLLNQGFVYEGNEHDRMKIKLGVSKNDSLYAMKVELLARLEIPTSAAFFLHNGVNPLTAQFVAFLRVFCMTHDELKEKLQGPQEQVQLLMKPHGEINNANEGKVLDFIQTRCFLLLRQYKTSIEEDQAVLLKKDVAPFTREIVKLLQSEKAILHKVVAYIKAQREVLESFRDGDGE